MKKIFILTLSLIIPFISFSQDTIALKEFRKEFHKLNSLYSDYCSYGREDLYKNLYSIIDSINPTYSIIYTDDKYAIFELLTDHMINVLCGGDNSYFIEANRQFPELETINRANNSIMKVYNHYLLPPYMAGLLHSCGILLFLQK